ncbi:MULTISPECIES: MFS transporter [Nocardiopsis]|uniref:MFS transporter n=1 Tax=Nocardiopsis TaxID=2013 RepID=UPI0003462D81|nr:MULTISPECIES: MFS transporter [Nocardiopsis]MEC3892648.1 MFS transporter [Nocardiopsis sp. LDBS1602]
MTTSPRHETPGPSTSEPATPTASPGDGRVSLLARLGVYTSLSTLADFVYGAVFVTVILARGADPWMVGAIIAAGQVIGLLMEAPSGALGDRYGHRRLLTVGLVFWGVGLLTIGMASGLVLTLVGMCLGHVGASLKSGTLSAILVNRVGTTDRTARIERIVRISAVSTRLGSVLGAASVMIAGTWLSAGPLVAVGGVLLLVLALLAPKCFPTTPVDPDRRVGAILVESVVLVASRRFLPLVLLASALMVATMLLVVAWQPLLAAEYGGEDVRLNGLVLLVMSLALMAGAACARWVDRDRPHLWGPVVASGIALPLLLAAYDVIPLVVGLVLAEFLIGLGGVLSGVWSQLMFTDANRNTMFSAVTVVTLFGAAVTTGSFGLLWDLWSIPTAVALLSVLALVVAMASLVLSRLVPESIDFTWAVRRNAEAEELDVENGERSEDTRSREESPKGP